MTAPELHALLEVSGHIVDSLTLAKVFDKLDVAGCRHKVRQIHIGENKHDVSTAQIDVWTMDKAALDSLMEVLQPYGIRRVEGASAPETSE